MEKNGDGVDASRSPAAGAGDKDEAEDGQAAEGVLGWDQRQREEGGPQENVGRPAT